jgi:WD40 repeat protein
VRFSADDANLIAHSWDGVVTGWTFEEKQRKVVRKFYFSPAQKIITVAPNHDGTILAVSYGNDDALAELWLMDDWGDHQKYMSLVGQSGPAYALDWHPQQASLVTGSADGTLSIWDVETGNVLQRFDLYDGIINAVRFSHNGNYIAAGCAVDSRIAIIDSRSNALIAELNAHRAGTDAVAWSADDKLVSCSDREKKLKVWSVVP